MGKGKLGAISGLEELLGLYPGPRGEYLRNMVATDTGLQARLAAADMDGTLAMELARAADSYVIPSAPARAIEAPMPGRKLDDEQTISRAVTDEVPFMAGSPPESLRGVHEELIAVPDNVQDSLGAFVERLGRSAPRPEFSLDTGAPPRFDFGMDALNNPTVRSQADTGSQWGGGWEGASRPTGMIPLGNRGPGVPVGGPTGSGTMLPESRALSTAVRPRPALEGPAQRRIGTTAPGPVVRRLEAPGVADEMARERAAMRALEDAVAADGGALSPTRIRRGGGGGGAPPTRRPAADSPGRRVAGRAAAGAAALAAGVALQSRRAGESESAGMSTADLAAEQNPPPQVMTKEPEPIAPPALSPREQALAMIAELNRMRREAGGEVPQAGQMMREIDRLMNMSNQAAASASRGEVAVGGGPREQAQTLLSQLNDMRRRAGGEVPQAQQILREVSRLNSMSDRQTNARTTAFPR